MLLDAAGQPLPPPLPPPMESDQHMVSSSGQLDINNQQMLIQQQLVDLSMYEANEQPPVMLDPNGQPMMSQHQHHQGPPVLVDSSGQPIPAHQVTFNGTHQYYSSQRSLSGEFTPFLNWNCSRTCSMGFSRLVKLSK